MHSSYILGLSLAGLALGQAEPCGYSDQPNLLQNPSFDDPLTDGSWSLYGIPDDSLSLSDVDPIDGTSHLVIL